MREEKGGEEEGTGERAAISTHHKRSRRTGALLLPVHRQLARAPKEHGQVVVENPALLRIRKVPRHVKAQLLRQNSPQLDPLTQIVLYLRECNPGASQQGSGGNEPQHCVVRT